MLWLIWILVIVNFCLMSNNGLIWEIIISPLLISIFLRGCLSSSYIQHHGLKNVTPWNKFLKAGSDLEQLSIEVSCSCFSGCLVFSGVTRFGHLLGKRGWKPPEQASMPPALLSICPDCPRPGAPSGSPAYQYVPLSRQKASFLLLFLHCKSLNFPWRKGGLDCSY